MEEHPEDMLEAGGGLEMQEAEDTEEATEGAGGGTDCPIWETALHSEPRADFSAAGTSK